MIGNENILNILSEAEIVYFSIFVIAELLTGFKGGNREKINKDILNNFLSKPTVKILSAGTETAEIFSEIKNSLKKAGAPIPINDIWIASNAVETGS